MIVTLTPIEMMTALHYASLIHETKLVNNNNNSVVNRRVATDLDDFNINLIGCVGEMAVCKLLGIQYQMTINKFGDRGFDMTKNGVKIQVKTTRRDYGNNSWFVFDDIEEVNADVIVQVAMIAPAAIKINGAITKDKCRRVMVTKNLGYRDQQGVPVSEFSPIEKFIDALKGVEDGH